jgi:hypothetical protein
MGRQLRRVAANWQHPKNQNGYYIPLFDRNFSEELAIWNIHKGQWDKGLRDDHKGGWQPKQGDEINMPFEEWYGNKPKATWYMPEWSDEEKTHIQLYENTTEGTPISEVYEASELETLCEYAAKNCTTFGEGTATKEEWMQMLK